MVTVRREVATSLLVLLTLVVGLASSASATLQCEAKVDRTTITSGDAVVLTVTARGDFGRIPSIAAPTITGVDVASGGTSQSFSFVNGATEASYAVTYYLQVRRPDNFTVPALEVKTGRERCATDPIAITVSGSAGVPPGTSGNRQPRPPQFPKTPPANQAAPRGSGPAAGRPGDEIFVTTSVDHDVAWVGEQIILSFKYFRRVNPWDNPSYDPPKTEGCWRLDLPPERNYRQTVNGLMYQVTEIRYALFATDPGKLEVGPARLTFPQDPFARLFPGRRKSQDLATAPLTVTVKELPLPRPADFSGLVASEIELTATVDRDTVPRGEPVSLDLRLRADAFLKSFSGLTVPAPVAARLHDAKEDLREDVSGPRYRATLTQEKVLVPTQEGTLQVPAVTLRYFDPLRAQYVLASSEPHAVVVTGSDLPVAGDEPSGFRRTEIERLSHDLAFIHPVTGRLGRSHRPWPERPLWWALVALPLVVLAGLRLALRRRAAALRDPAGVRRRRALADARKLLATVPRSLDPQDQLTTIAAAITGYVADRTNRAAAGLTGAEVRAHGERLGRPEVGVRLARALGQCDSVRFGGAQVANPLALATEVADLLAQLDHGDQSSAAGRGVTTVLVCILAMGLVTVSRAATTEPAAGPAPGADPARLVAEGNQAYTDGDIATALARYQAARDAGTDDALLDYDLGNAYARDGRLGRAIASYLRSLRKNPRDHDARANLAWVRSHTRDLELGSRHLPPVVAQIDAALGRVSLNEWSLVTLLLVWATAGLLALVWWRGYLGEGLRRGLIAAITCLAIAGGVTIERWIAERVRDVAVVIADEAEVRSGPATSFPVAFRVHDGLTLTVRGEHDDWARIGLGGEWVGWVPQGTLERVRRPLSAHAPGR